MTALLPAVAGILIVVLAAAFALLPLLRGRAQAMPLPDTSAGDVDDAMVQRLQIYQQIIELEFDQQTGKLSVEDCQELSSELLARAARLLRADAREDVDVDEEIEAEIAAARRAGAGRLVGAAEAAS